ncbi:HAD family hydrolase [Streptomyces sp. NPDC052013]|uniref:HAD family hydrolase n=1 Tax=Streptomyces sp. NPDC052013 TaxID=3365679 RepID=UPI0037CDE829
MTRSNSPKPALRHQWHVTDGQTGWLPISLPGPWLPSTAELALLHPVKHNRAYPGDLVYLRNVLRLTDDAQDLWCEYVDGVARSAHCLPGVLELQALRSDGWKLGVATNGAVDIQRAKLDGAGLAGLFDGVTISEGVGVRKPERALFEAAAAACGVPLSAGSWMVGDNPATDIAGAQTAGLRTAWVAGGREWGDGPQEPDIIVSSAAEAIATLRRSTR